MPISDTRLNAIRKRAEAATEGPWRTGDKFLSGSLGSHSVVLAGTFAKRYLGPLDGWDGKTMPSPAAKNGPTRIWSDE